MTRWVFAPGSDDTGDAASPFFQASRGPGGQFAKAVKGSTPKYAVNAGLREEQYKNTMARMFVRVDQSEFGLFRSSLADPTVIPAATQLAGDPSSHGVGSNDTGYMDFLLSSVQHSFREKVQSVETLSDNYVVYYFGQSAPVWTYSGRFINTVQDDQASNFVRLYLEVLRGTQLARRSKVVTLRYDSFAVSGTIEALDWTLQAENELLCPFTMMFRVKRLYTVNYTAGWRPTQPQGAIADPNSLAFDGTQNRSRRFAYQLFGTVPPDLQQVLAPTPESQVPPNANPQQSSVDNSSSNNTPNENPNVRNSRPVSTPNTVLASGL